MFAEQISVLSEERIVTAEHLLELIPNLLKRHLPMITEKDGPQDVPLKEREILYKVLFEMKRDLRDLKGLVFEIIRSNNLQVPDISEVRSLASSTTTESDDQSRFSPYPSHSVEDLLEGL